MINITAANPEAKVPKAKKRERRVIPVGRGNWGALKDAMASVIRRCRKSSQAIFTLQKKIAQFGHLLFSEERDQGAFTLLAQMDF
jgi:hypothetical protein